MSKRGTDIAESAVILLGIGSLWPWILGYRDLPYTAFAVGVLVLLGVVAWRRVTRVKRALEALKSQARTPPGTPGEPPNFRP